jgi:hypothetical protein
MMRKHENGNLPDLEDLAAQAREYALHMMRTGGSVPPTVIAATGDGYAFCMPAELADVAAKDRFAEATRLFAIAHNARSLVMVVEAWAKLPDASGHLDLEIPPSLAADRKEVVVLMLEDHFRNATSMLPILRDDSGAFTGFGEAGPLRFGQSEGRFSGLMPRNKPGAREAELAKAALLALGMTVVHRGFDPSMN